MAAMPEFRWLAVKVTPHRHDKAEEILEELDCASAMDTGRYLAAGARRAFLVSGVAEFRAAELVSEARSDAPQCNALLIESNRIGAAMVGSRDEAAVHLAVLAGPEVEWKASLLECMGRVDAVVLAHGLSSEGFISPFRRKPVFQLLAGQWGLPELVRFVRSRLLGVG
jgi:hypothetical protein